MRISAIFFATFFMLSFRAEAAPPNPNSFSGTAVSGNEIQFTWNSGGGSTTGFYLNYNQGTSYPRSYCRTGTQIDVGNATSYSLQGLNPNTTYSFRLCAYDSSNSKSKGKRIRVTTLNQSLPAPSITSLTPNTGYDTGGTAITITGTDFSSPSVSLGGSNCAVTSSSSTSISCTTTAHAVGIVSATVTNSDSQADTLANAYTYTAAPPAFVELSVVTDFTLEGNQDWADGVVAQPDGKIVVGGRVRTAGNINLDYLVARYNANGTLDSSFGTNGRVLVGFGGSHDVGHGIALDSQGRIIVVGYTRALSTADYDYGIARLNANGSLDTTFNGTGMLTIDWHGFNDQAYALAVDSNDKIIVIGKSGLTGGNFDYAIARLNTNGSIDWQVETEFITNAIDVPWGVAIQNDGKIVVAGRTQAIGGNKDCAISRYNTNGTIDTTFGTNGKVITIVDATIDDNYFGVQMDGNKIIGVGKQITGPDMDLFLTRYNSDGTLDTTFDGDGIALKFLSASDDKAFELVVDTQGRYLVAASIGGGVDDWDFGIMRFNSDGSLDGTFGPSAQGYEQFDFGTTRDQAFAIAWDANNKLVMAGRADQDTLIMRINPDGQ